MTPLGVVLDVTTIIDHSVLYTFYFYFASTPWAEQRKQCVGHLVTKVGSTLQSYTDGIVKISRTIVVIQVSANDIPLAGQ